MPFGMCRRGRRPGFTMIELLTVIGIIIILMAILLPVIGSIRKRGFQTATAAQVERLATACQNYYHDYTAYPGPVPDTMLNGYTGTGVVPLNITGLTKITATENMILGLCGGLVQTGTSASPSFKYDATVLGKGPQGLNPADPKQSISYYDVGQDELNNDGVGNLSSYAGAIYTIPELRDKFPDPHAIIYLRARAGAMAMVDNPAASGSQYYSQELLPYWVGNTAGVPFPTKPDTNNNNSPLYNLATDFFKNPSINDGNTPRSKDSFIIVSAGYDGIYGTSDDIVYSN